MISSGGVFFKFKLKCINFVYDNDNMDFKGIKKLLVGIEAAFFCTDLVRNKSKLENDAFLFYIFVIFFCFVIFQRF